MGTLTDQEICIKLKNLYDETENRIKTNAMVSRAYIDKTSSDTINEKVNAQMNSIQAGIYNINPKFKEGSKNYEQTKKLVAETLASYEAALLELSQFYDGKIEQLILRKVELEAGLIGMTEPEKPKSGNRSKTCREERAHRTIQRRRRSILLERRRSQKEKTGRNPKLH